MRKSLSRMRSTSCEWAIAALLVVACGGVERRFTGGAPEGPIAVGATAIGGVGSETCRRGERGSWCDMNSVEIRSLASEPVGIFALSEAPPGLNNPNGGAIDFRALAEGTAKLTIVASDGFETKTFTEELKALAVNDVHVAPVGPLGQPCSEPLLYSTATSIQLPFELRHDATLLQGASFYPFDGTGVTIAPAQIDLRKLGITTPAVAGVGSLTSPADPTFALAIQAVVPSDVQAIRIGEPSRPITAPYSFYSGSTVLVDLEVVGRAVCESNWSRTFSTSTPEQCILGNGTTERKTTFTSPRLSFITIYGIKPGTCTLTVALDGTTVAATKNFSVGN